VAAVVLRWQSRGAGVAAALGVLTIVAVTSTAGAAPANVDIELNVGASPTATGAPPLIPSGGTANLSRRNFVVYVDVSLITPAPGGRPRVRVELGGGLQWGADDPDPTEGCTSTPTTGECQLVVDLQPIPGQSGGGWLWDVVAPQNGTYTFRAELYDLAQPDPVLANNSSTITLVVNEEAGGGAGSGGGSGGGGSGGGGSGGAAAVRAGAARLSPAKPKAGSVVVAAVRVTRGGAALRPSGVACSASIGKVRVKGTAKAGSGVASCGFRTPKSAKGNTLAGTVSFRAGGQRFAKRFSVRLG
jgi:hypothetical protein